MVHALARETEITRNEPSRVVLIKRPCTLARRYIISVTGEGAAPLYKGKGGDFCSITDTPMVLAFPPRSKGGC